MSIRLKQRGAHMTELRIDGLGEVLFSYETPVAARVEGRGWIRTEKFWSQTTSKHITRWLDGIEAEKVPQSVLDSLLVSLATVSRYGQRI